MVHLDICKEQGHRAALSASLAIKTRNNQLSGAKASGARSYKVAGHEEAKNNAPRAPRKEKKEEDEGEEEE